MKLGLSVNQMKKVYSAYQKKEGVTIHLKSNQINVGPNVNGLTQEQENMPNTAKKCG